MSVTLGGFPGGVDLAVGDAVVDPAGGRERVGDTGCWDWACLSVTRALSLAWLLSLSAGVWVLGFGVAPGVGDPGGRARSGVGDSGSGRRGARVVSPPFG